MEIGNEKKKSYIQNIGTNFLSGRTTIFGYNPPLVLHTCLVVQDLILLQNFVL